MSKTFLIARREYLAFVRTVGFWLSLFTLPTIFAASVFIPMMMRQSAPVQTVAVLDLTGNGIKGDIEGFIRAQAPKKEKGPFDDSGLQLIPAPPELAKVRTVAEAETVIGNVLASGQVDTVVIAGDSGDRLYFRIWSDSGHKQSVEKKIEWDLHGLQYYKVAQLKGVDPALAHEMRGARAEIWRANISLFTRRLLQ